MPFKTLLLLWINFIIKLFIVVFYGLRKSSMLIVIIYQWNVFQYFIFVIIFLQKAMADSSFTRSLYIGKDKAVEVARRREAVESEMKAR